MDELESDAELLLSAVMEEGRTWRSKVIVSVSKIDKKILIIDHIGRNDYDV